MHNCDPTLRRYRTGVSCRHILHEQRSGKVQDSQDKRCLLNFRFLQTMQAIRLVRGTNSSRSSLSAGRPSAFFGLSDRSLETFSSARRERSLKKSSLRDEEFRAILLFQSRTSEWAGFGRGDSGQWHAFHQKVGGDNVQMLQFMESTTSTTIEVRS